MTNYCRFGRGPKLAAALLTLAAAPLLSQSRVMIGARPAPNQTARLRMVQELEMSMKAAGPNVPPGFPADGLNVSGNNMLLLRQEVGEADEKGRLRLVLTYEEVGQTMRLNDKEVPIPAETLNLLRGKSVTMWMGPKREILEVITPDKFPLPGDQLQQVLGPLQASLPSQEMSVGETVALPFSMPLPIPVPGANAPPRMEGQTRTTLTKVSPEGGDQLAFLDQSIELSLDTTAATSSGSNVRMDLKMSGAGTTELLVRSGLLKSTRMDATMSGQFEPPGSGATPIKVDGKLRVTVTREP
jgi:hypothetical protein